MRINKGMKETHCMTVGTADTARHMKSGSLDVFSTPSMIALMEEISCGVISDALEDGFTSVGTRISVRHLSATPVGAEVTCESELTEIDGRRLVFCVKVFDIGGLIGEGIHERFIVKSESFMTKTVNKLTEKKDN